MTLVSFMRSKQWPRLSRLESVVNRGDQAAWVHSKDLCGADDGAVVRQKKPILGRLTSGNLHRLTPGREACESLTLSARL